MARIHTHYDNLKVSRKAPQEVIRAAYKALSQKYHPDKNPHDEKAARIMAILNSAYGTLADPVRRHEHDEWIAAEEWEIDWLESTRADDGRELAHGEGGQWRPELIDDAVTPRLRRNPLWWLSLALCLALGCAAGVLLMIQLKVAPVPTLAPVVSVAAVAPPPVVPVDDPLHDGWAVSQAPVPDAARSPEVLTLGITELVIPKRAPDCDMALTMLASPNGEAWPAQSGYVDGFPVGNQGKEMQIVLDNGANSSPVLVKVYDLERRSNVRHVFVLANQSMTVENLAAGRYEVRYQNIAVGGSKEECLVRRAPAVVRAEP
ncbi:J domain-containing protein [Massilia sp. TWP1-3-3]|uniref:J domain-containing protein n=1 Tax=Massilia sp. TWP1-3-3 TaxID=2804573 RepID=UPI003CF419A7